MKNRNNKNDNENKCFLSTGDKGDYFEILVKGQLDKSWSDWLESLDVKLQDHGEMMLSGHIRDQAALMGILNKLYSLNLTLLSINKVNPEK
jgi:hypothetical protein